VGLEKECLARFRGRSSSGRARLEEKLLDFKGTFRLKIPFVDMRSISAGKGILRIEFSDGTAEFQLDAQAEKWAQQILHPKGLIDKLGVKPSHKVSVLGLKDPSFLELLRGRASRVSVGRTGRDLDLVFVLMKDRTDLARLAGMGRSINDGGGVWVLWPKGQKAFREDDIRAAGPAAGLVDVKVVSFSETLSGLKMVKPLANRRRSR
jgi:hypothetical protein